MIVNEEVANVTKSITSLDPIPCSSCATGHKTSDMYDSGGATIVFDKRSDGRRKSHMK
jgi:hypothetical protein